MQLDDLTITKHGDKLVVCHVTRGKLGTIDMTTGATKDAKRGTDVGSWVSGRGMSVVELIAAMATTTFEVREQTSTTDPADRGILIRVCQTFAAAQQVRDAAWANGRVAYISKIEAA